MQLSHKTGKNLLSKARALTAALLLASTTLGHAAEVGPLIDLLVQKKILSSEDAEKLRKDLAKADAKANANSPLGKLKIAESDSEVKLYGDLRLRYQYDQSTVQKGNPSTVSSSGAQPTDAKAGALPNTNQRSRERFRLRVGADIKVDDQIYGGFGLATGPSADSNIQTLTGGFDNYNIYINKAFIGWKPTDWINLLAGKYENPIYSTDLVWDPDINPQGLSQSFDLTKALAPDNKKLSVQFLANELIFFDNDEFRTGNLGKDSWIFSGQLKTTYKATPDVAVTFAPGFHWSNGGSATGLNSARVLSNATFPNYTAASQTQTVTTNTTQRTIAYDANGVPTVTDTPTNRSTATTITDPATGNLRYINGKTVTNRVDQVYRGNATTGLPQFGLPKNPSLANKTFVTTTASAKGNVKITSPQPEQRHNEQDDLAILTAPGDVTFKLFGEKAKIYWDFAYNLQGKSRYNDVLGLRNPIVIATQDPNYPNIITTRRLGGQSYHLRDGLAWLAGFQLGENKKKGDLSLLVNYRQTGVAAVDPNLNDSDVFQSAINIGGVRTAVVYNLADSITLGAAYSHGTSLDRNLAGGLAAAVADLKSVDVIQVDLNWKF
jgi:Putative porin